MGTFIGLLVGAAVFFGFISFALYKSLIEMSRIDQLPTVENEKIKQTDLHQWATSNGFVYLETFLMEISGVRTFVAAWQHQQEPTFFAAYITQSYNNKTGKTTNTVKQQRAFDLITYFTGDHSLTTGNSPSGIMFPMKDGVYRQNFKTDELDELRQKHNEAVTYITSFGAVRQSQIIQPVHDYIIEALHATTEYVRSLPLWPLRGMYWYFIRKQLWNNLTIQTQHEKRMIKLPNEL